MLRDHNTFHEDRPARHSASALPRQGAVMPNLLPDLTAGQS